MKNLTHIKRDAPAPKPQRPRTIVKTKIGQDPLINNLLSLNGTVTLYAVPAVDLQLQQLSTLAKEALVIILGTRVLILVSREVLVQCTMVSFKSCVYVYLCIAAICAA